jgi:hypothetical protein
LVREAVEYGVGDPDLGKAAHAPGRIGVGPEIAEVKLGVALGAVARRDRVFTGEAGGEVDTGRIRIVLGVDVFGDADRAIRARRTELKDRVIAVTFCVASSLPTE